MTGRRPRAAPRPSGIITLLTDFGLDDPYVAAVKGVLLGINPRACLVDLTHTIPPQDILTGALAVERAYRFFPPGTVHLAVVDPGVGGPRRALAALANDHYFVGPDNGLLGFPLETPGASAVALTNRVYHRRAISRTFHARDIFAPVAAHCSRGVPLSRFGPVVRGPVRLSWPSARAERDRLIGEVLLADRFGNLLSNLMASDVPVDPAGCQVRIGRRGVGSVVGTYRDRPVGAVGALFDSSGRLEIFVRDGSAQHRLRVTPGTAVSLSWSARTSRRRVRRTGETAMRRSRSRPPAETTTLRWRSRRARAPTSSRTRGPSSAIRTGSRSHTSRSPSG